MLKTIQWALKYAGIQTESCLFTLLLLLLNRPQSACKSLLNHLDILYFTTTQDLLFLDSASWTGQADYAQNF